MSKRQDYNYSRSGILLEDVQVEDLLSGVQEENPSFEIGSQREDSAI